MITGATRKGGRRTLPALEESVNLSRARRDQTFPRELKKVNTATIVKQTAERQFVEAGFRLVEDVTNLPRACQGKSRTRYQ
jgi:hypothetical protein